MTLSVRIVVSALLLVLGGCASIDPTPDYRWAEEEVIAATGSDVIFQPGEDVEGQARVEALLEDGLTSHEAVQVALLNNRGLQEQMFEIGIRHADVVQAGLLSNPSLNALVRFPGDNGSATTEGGILQNLIELWQIPARKRLAESQLERTVLEVAHQAVVVAAQAKSLYFTALASAASLDVAEENLKTSGDFLELTLERQEAGAATQVDVNAARSSFLEQQVRVRAAKFAAVEAKRSLALVLGFATPPEEIVLSETLTGFAGRTLELEWLLTVASEYRLDLRSVKKNVAATENVIPLARRRAWRNLSGGLAFESEGGELALGPAIKLDLPIFDQNQAQIAKAELRYAQALRRLEGVIAEVCQQVRGAYMSYMMAQDMAHLYQTELLPLREVSLDLARESFAAGKTGFLSVLEAQERLLQTRREYVDRLEAVALSIPGLEAACGRPLDVLLELDE
jgi:outer membrane protein, heavy metal efflux system